MLNVLETLLGVFDTAVSFIVNIVEGIASMIAMIPQSMTMVTNVIAYIPAELAVFATASIAITVVYLIIGR